MMHRTLLAVLAALAVAPPSHAEEGIPPLLPPKANISAKQVKSLKPGVYEVPESHGLLLTFVAPGAFKMGSPKREIGREADERRRKIRITKPFYMGITEVTQAQYLNAMYPNHVEYCQNKGPWGHTLPSFTAGGPWGVDRTAGPNAGLKCDHPMDMLTWEEAVAYAAWLNKRELKAGRLPEGYAYRLPTEAEWEYACRAGSKGQFGLEGKPAEFLAFSAWNFDGIIMSPFGRRKPNAWGLYDMHGSLYEWVHDWYAPYDKKQKKDPQGPAAGEEKVMRGGAYVSYSEKDGEWETTEAEKMRNIRSSSRNHLPADYELPVTGMRMVLGPKLSERAGQ